MPLCQFICCVLFFKFLTSSFLRISWLSRSSSLNAYFLISCNCFMINSWLIIAIWSNFLSVLPLYWSFTSVFNPHSVINHSFSTQFVSNLFPSHSAYFNVSLDVSNTHSKEGRRLSLLLTNISSIATDYVPPTTFLPAFMHLKISMSFSLTNVETFHLFSNRLYCYN